MSGVSLSDKMLTQLYFIQEGKVRKLEEGSPGNATSRSQADNAPCILLWEVETHANY